MRLHWRIRSCPKQLLSNSSRTTANTAKALVATRYCTQTDTAASAVSMAVSSTAHTYGLPLTGMAEAQCAEQHMCTQYTCCDDNHASKSVLAVLTTNLQ